jgi:hypothetical protein
MQSSQNSTRVGSSLVAKNEKRMEVTGSAERSSLSWYGINYGRKSLDYSCKRVYKTKHSF